jgi:hypothetical protein
VLTGGFSEQELREAGAAQVFERLEDLIAHLGETALSAVCPLVETGEIAVLARPADTIQRVL